MNVDHTVLDSYQLYRQLILLRVEWNKIFPSGCFTINYVSLKIIGIYTLDFSISFTYSLTPPKQEKMWTDVCMSILTYSSKNLR